MLDRILGSHQRHLVEDADNAAAEQVGDERELYLVFVMTRPGSESLGEQFLNSFKIN